MKTVLYSGAVGRSRRRVSGNLMPLSWNCIVLARLHAAAGTVAVLMTCFVLFVVGVVGLVGGWEAA